MNPLLSQFLSEARDFLYGIGEKLLQLESQPDSTDLMTELFRLVHTLKGNSGLFEFPEMTRVLHAGEDLLDRVREGRVAYSQALADVLLEAMDFIVVLLDEIEASGRIGATHASTSAHHAASLRALMGEMPEATASGRDSGSPAPSSATSHTSSVALPLEGIPEDVRMALYRAAVQGDPLTWVEYRPDEECFFKGEDPLYQVSQVPETVWRQVAPRQPWPPLAELDAYRCQLVFQLLSTAEPALLHELFRYMPSETRIIAVPPLALVLPQGEPNGGPVYEDFVSDALAALDLGDVPRLERMARTLLELSAPSLWLSSALRWLLLLLELSPDQRAAQRMLVSALRTLSAPDWHVLAQTESSPDATSTGPVAPASNLSPALAAAFADIVQTQRDILAQADDGPWLAGRLQAVAAALSGCFRAAGQGELTGLDAALAAALQSAKAAPLADWLARHLPPAVVEAAAPPSIAPEAKAVTSAEDSGASPEASGNGKYGRRAEDAFSGPRSLKVDQAKIDHLMNLIGEMVVAKNSLPYLAARAENQYGVRELAREIKAQHAVVNRIAEAMQDAIMQVRMMPVSFIFQRFPRLVRDTMRKLGKEVNLVLEGESTEADKNIVEALADPLIHIVRNSLDHGIELPQVRRAAGKPAEGRLCIRASQEADRVVIEIADDGKGIDPVVVKRKALEKGLCDAATLERMSDQEAIHLIFAAGFSTAEVVSDLSGRGVGMDVVRSAVEKVNGSVSLHSTVGLGTTLRLSLPLSMAVTHVMIVESDRQIFGVPMDMVVETVRVPRSDIRSFKQRRTTVLRGSIVPLLSLNELLGVPAEQCPNADDAFATLVVRLHGENVGIVVDDFHEAVDIILKPLAGFLGGLSCYAGSALLGDGTVLMVLNPRELA